jgi:hypothetical protein
MPPEAVRPASASAITVSNLAEHRICGSRSSEVHPTSTTSPPYHPRRCQVTPNRISERRILQLAASIAAGTPVSLRDAIPGLDNRNLQLAITAIQHTAGQRPPRY